MSNFFEKLKKGMGAEGDIEENLKEEIEKEEPKKEAKEEAEPARNASQGGEKTEEQKTSHTPKKQRVKRTKEKKIGEKPEEKPEEKTKETDPSEQEIEKIEPTEIEIKKGFAEKEKKEEEKEEKEEGKKEWSDLNKKEEGQLVIDVYQTEDELVLQSAIAGAKPESLDISVEGDMITIKGLREKPEEAKERNYFYEECFWGPFSRQIILSVEVDPSRTEASLKDGILTIRIPKIERDKKRKIEIKQ